MDYDFLMVGAGLYSAVVAYEMTKQGKKCCIIDRRPHLGGNIYTEKQEEIFVHKYGAHIFHTSSKEIWEYINRFAEFQPFINAPVANYKGKMLNLPFNMNTFAQMWGISTPEQAKEIIRKQVAESGITHPSNLEEKAISLVGTDIYHALIKGYTEKQWGVPCCELPEFIINRLPLRFTYDNNYFNDRYQGIPVGGYTKIVENMLKGCDVLLNTSYKDWIGSQADTAKTIIYTGSVDELMDYELGALEYRSLEFEEKVLDTENYQGNAVVNYTEKEIPYTRIIEHKFFEWKEQSKTILSYEYPVPWQQGMEAYYPVNNEKNRKKYEDYLGLVCDKYPNICLGGRLGLYQYLDMDKIIERARKQCQELKNRARQHLIIPCPRFNEKYLKFA